MLKQRVDNFFALLLSLLIFIPTSNTGNIIRLVTLLLFAFVSFFSNSGRINTVNLKFSLFLMFSPLFSAFIVYMMEGAVDTSRVSHEIIRMLFCALLLYVVRDMVIKMRTVYFCTLIVFVPNFIIQILQYLKVSSINTFIRKYYVFTNEWSHLELANGIGSSFRSGSIFLNPNVFMVIPLVALCVFLFQDRKKNNLINTILIICTGISSLLTGSRTAIVITAIILFIYLVKYAKIQRKFFFLAMLIAIVIFFGAFIIQNSRATDIFDSGSFEYKFNAFSKYFETTLPVPLYWLTGSLGTEYYWNMDGEWGFVYSWYGVVGLIWYLKYYKTMWNNNNHIVFFSKVITIVCILVAITASVLLCMSTFSFVALIAFAKIESNDNTLQTDLVRLNTYIS